MFERNDYIKHNQFVDVVFKVLSVDMQPNKLKLYGEWINVVTKPYSAGDDIININYQDLKNWNIVKL